MKFKKEWNINTILLIIIIVILVIFGFYLFNPDGVWEILESIYYTSNIFTPV
jgi:sulfite exporter TauE/SafE